MSKSMRAKVMVIGVTKPEGWNAEVVKFQPVTGKDPFGPNGESEDNTYSRWTPSGSIELTITNPELHGVYAYGQTFYVDFTPVAAPEAAHA